jgi:hypothetical protein
MSSNRKICVIYHYHRVDEVHEFNLSHFLLLGYLENVDFFIISTSPEIGLEPKPDNVNYVYHENKNNDYGGYSHAIHNAIPIARYEYFIFINSSVRGPYFLPHASKDWTLAFTNFIVGDTGIVGASINISPENLPISLMYRKKHGGSGPCSHVQSMVFALPKIQLSQLIDSEFFGKEDFSSKDELVVDYEIHLSQLIISNGMNIKCLLPEYNVIDYRHPHREINPSSLNGDPFFENCYFGRSIHPYESLFVKTNRNIYPKGYLERLTFSMIQNGVKYPSPFLSGSHAKYIEEIKKSTHDGNRMPTIQDRQNSTKLSNIITSTNQILNSNLD